MELVSDIADKLSKTLDDTVTSVNSIEGVIVLLLIAFIIYSVVEKSFQFLKFSVGVLLIIEIGYVLSITGFNGLLPFNRVFKYDVLTSLAQLCVGTKVSNVLLTIDAWFIAFFQQLWVIVVNTWNGVRGML